MLKKFLHTQWLPRMTYAAVILANLLGVIDISWWVVAAPVLSIPAWGALVVLSAIALGILEHLMPGLLYEIEHADFKTHFKKLNPWRLIKVLPGLIKTIVIGSFKFIKVILIGK